MLERHPRRGKMKLEVHSRDGAGRTGRAKIDDKEFNIPNIIFVDTPRFRSPDFAELVGRFNNSGKREKIIVGYPEYVWSESKRVSSHLSLPRCIPYPSNILPIPSTTDIQNGIWKIYAEEEKKRRLSGGIFTISNAISLYPRSRDFVRRVVKVRERIGYNSLLHLPGVADVKNLSLLVYMGVDLFDSVKAIICARRGFLFFPEGSVHKDHLREKICHCRSCNKFDDPSEMKFEDILLHNLIMMANEIERIRSSIFRGSLRELIESRISNSPELTEKFRVLNMEFYEFLEERTPILKRTKLKAVLRESINYPEIERFRRRVIERYRKPESAKILLLLPCSAKKPYSLSKTHRMFRDQISKSGNPHIIHEIIITSPIGIVPRELEMVYPANSYDVPVTGHWFEDELEMIRNALVNYGKKNKYDIVMSHLQEELNLVVEDVFKEVITTCLDNNPTSKDSLENLRRSLSRVVSDYSKISGEKRLKEDLLSLASYQFGESVARELIKEEYQVKGRYPNLRIFAKDKHICSLSRERGLISLTLEGARILASKDINTVEIEEGLEIRGSVLAPCVEWADDRIRIEDEVAVIRGDEVYAVGTAKMNGREMVELSYGEAVKIRAHA